MKIKNQIEQFNGWVELHDAFTCRDRASVAEVAAFWHRVSNLLGGDFSDAGGEFETLARTLGYSSDMNTLI